MNKYTFTIQYRKGHELFETVFIGTKEEFDTFVIENGFVIEHLQWEEFS